MVALPGFWRSAPDSTLFFSCESPNGLTLCTGGQTASSQNHTELPQSVCRQGHQGVLCSKCSEGYGKTYGVCTRCNSSFNASGIVFVCCAVAAFMILLYALISNNLKKATGATQTKAEDAITLSVVKIVINWLQMASIAAQVRPSTPPHSYSLALTLML